MKVVFLGPATAHLDEWLRALTREGLNLALITLHRDVRFSKEHHCIDLSERVRNRFSYAALLPEIRAALKAERPDLLVSYYATSYGFLGRLSGFSPRIVVTAGSDINLNGLRQCHLRALTHVAFSGAARIVGWSASMKQAIQRFGVADERIFILPRGIALDRFKRRPRPAGQISIVSTRRMTANFNHLAIIRACSELRDREIPFHLRLCDSGPQRREIEALVSSAKLGDRVTFLGPINHSAVADLLSESDISISLPYHDGASASLFESMAAGCYPIVSRIPANATWIQDRVNGRLVDPDDARQLADALLDLARNPDELARVAAVNRRIAEESLDIRGNSRAYRTLFEQVAAQQLTP